MSDSTVYCKNCALLDLKGEKPFCVWLLAFIEPALLDQPWQCEGYKKKAKGT
jgi:hypothetical protein